TVGHLFFSGRRRHTSFSRDWSSDVCSSDLGATTLGGSLPVNVSGGLVSKGHPIGATGLSMVYEITKQLRGEGGEAQVKDARLGRSEERRVGKEGSSGAETALCKLAQRVADG